MFTYKGKSSEEMHLVIVDEVPMLGATRDAELIEVPGRSGDLVLDKGRFRSVVHSLDCRVIAQNASTMRETVRAIHNWLLSDAQFHEFEWKNDPDYLYFAKVEGSVETNRVIETFGNSRIDFRFQPIKLLKSGLVEREVTSGSQLTNPFDLAANPTVRIVGSGDMTLQIGESRVVLRGISGGCIIDTENQMITSLDGTRMLFTQMRSLFPVLGAGRNTITFPSGLRMFVAPRWGCLL